MKGGNEATNGSGITHSPSGEQNKREAAVLNHYCLLPLAYCLTYSFFR